MTTNFPGKTMATDQHMDYFRLAILLTAVFLMHIFSSKAQNVGIGTVAPQRKLTVNGSIMLDQGNQNNGTLDTAALIFGSAATVGINSKKTGAGSNGLSFWTAGVPQLNLGSDGHFGIGGVSSASYKLRVYNGNSYFEGNIYGEGSMTALTNAAIGGNLDPAYKLRVYDGATRFGGDMHATGNVAIGGEVDNSYRLRIIGGNSRFGGDFHATGNAAIGGDVDNNFRLRVYGGNSRFGGNAEVTGALTASTLAVDNSITASSLTVDNTLTIGGKGSVRSNGASPLRIGFDTKSVNVFIANNDGVYVTANITDFEGDFDDVRTFVSQVKNDIGGSLEWYKVGITVMGVNPDDNTCILWLHNRSGGNGILKGTIYLTTIAKN
ncbi:MAG: hypothetical protein WCF67_10395 [Chitinophagaceae bacterium]